MLGHSIFRSYWPLYTKAGKKIDDLLQLPLVNDDRRSRFRKLLTDRKGLLEFQRGMAERGEAVDPRRIATLTIRNIAWAEWGEYPISVDAAMGAASDLWSQMFPRINAERARKLLRSNRDETPRQRSAAQQLVEDAIAYAQANS